MPTIEHLLAQPRTNNSDASPSYSKLLAFYNSPVGPSGNSPAARANRVFMSLKDSKAYETSLSNFDSDTYGKTAGADLSSFLMPYETFVNHVSGLPCFYSGIGFPYGYQWRYPSGILPSFMDYLPIDWEPQSEGYIYDLWQSPSGDGMLSLASSSGGYFGDTNRYRDKYDIRGIALRGPLMVSSWGFDLTTRLPFPSGHQRSDDMAVYPSGTAFFKGGNLFGYNVSPDDYVTAPLEMYYDQTRNLWTLPSIPSNTGLYKVLMLLDDKNPGTAQFDYCRFSS